MGGFVWGEVDHLLTFAYTLYLAGMCSCGHPTKVCQHPDNDGWFEAKSVVCNAQAEIDRITGAEKYKPAPGERFYTEYTRPADKPLRALTPDAKPDDRGDEPGKGDERRESVEPGVAVVPG